MYAKEIAIAVFDGVVSIPIDLAYGVRRTFEDFGGSGNATRLSNAAENKRVAIIIENAIKFANTDAGPITKILKIILEEFYQDIPDDVIEKVAKKTGIGATYMTSRVATQAALVNLIAKKLTAQITAKVIARRLAKMGVGFALGALIIQGMIEKASESAKRLMITHPIIYHKLRAQNIDMAYFLVEDSMSKTMEAIRIKSGNPEKFKKILREIENEVMAD
jgi:hypothetical protein